MGHGLCQRCGRAKASPSRERKRLRADMTMQFTHHRARLREIDILQQDERLRGRMRPESSGRCYYHFSRPSQTRFTPGSIGSDGCRTAWARPNQIRPPQKATVESQQVSRLPTNHGDVVVSHTPQQARAECLSPKIRTMFPMP